MFVCVCVQLEDTLPAEVSSNTILLASILHSFKAEPVLVLKRYPRFYELNGECERCSVGQEE